MSKKEVPNMKPKEHPYLEKPKDFDPAKPNKDVKEYGGGGRNGEKK